MNKVEKRVAVAAPQGFQNVPMRCGPGCACGDEMKTSKWKIVIMLVVLAAVGIALVFRVAL